MLTYGGSIFISLVELFEALLLDWAWMSQCMPIRTSYLRQHSISRREVRKLERCSNEHCPLPRRRMAACGAKTTRCRYTEAARSHSKIRSGVLYSACPV